MHSPSIRMTPQENMVNSHFSIHPPGVPLNTKYGGCAFPAAVTVRAIVTCIVEEDDLQTFTVLIPHLSSVLFLVSWRRKEVFGPCWQSIICLDEDLEDSSPTPSHIHPLQALTSAGAC